MVVTTATGTIPCPLKGGLTVILVCPSGGSAAYTGGVVDMVPGKPEGGMSDADVAVEISAKTGWGLRSLASDG